MKGGNSKRPKEMKVGLAGGHEDEGSELNDGVLPVLLEEGLVVETYRDTKTSRADAEPPSAAAQPPLLLHSTSPSAAAQPPLLLHSTLAGLPQSASFQPKAVVEQEGPPRSEPDEATPSAGPRLSLVGAFCHIPGEAPVSTQEFTSRSLSQLSLSSSTTSSPSQPPNPSVLDTDGLAQARPVDEEDERRVDRQDATPVDPNRLSTDDPNMLSTDEKQKKWCMLGLLSFLIVVFLVAIIGSAFSKRKGSTEIPEKTLTPSVVQTNLTTAPPSPVSMTLMIDHSLLSNKTIQAMKVPLSPQNKAYEWLALHPAVSTMADWRKVQLFALATFFYQFHGEDWENVIRSDWLVYDKSECDWYSDIFAHALYNLMEGKYVLLERNTNETTCNELGEFTRLSIAMPGSKTSSIPSSMPPEVALLTALEEIMMGSIATSGPLSDFIIPELKSLHNLRSIHLDNIAVTGTIPLSIFDLLPTELEEFKIKGQLVRLSGTLPSQFQLFSNLKSLQISNGLNGTIPSVLGKLTLLESLWLPNEDITGTIPLELYGLNDLKELSLRPASRKPMHLTGTLSSHLGQLTNLELLQIAAQLSGTIPNSIQNLVGLERLMLHHNKFSGPPPLLGQFSQLNFVDLSNNWLEGPMPEDMFTSSAAIEHLDLSANFLSGTVPSNLWSLSSLKRLRLANNAGLVGDLPASQLKSFSQLVSLKISANSFHGTIPFSAFSNSSRLSILQLDNNTFSGSISSELGLLTRLSDLNLADNGMLSGSIPVEIGNCTWMKSLQFQGNSFTGSIPSQLGLLKYLNKLNLSKNSGLVGSIPSELGLLTRLESLVLDGTSLSGSVPEEVCQLKNQTVGSLVAIQVNCSMLACSCNCTCFDQGDKPQRRA